jgi:hypothetical protein
MNKVHEIIFKKKSVVVAHYDISPRRDEPTAFSLIAEFMKLGYAFDSESILKLSYLNKDVLKDIHREYLPFIAKHIGADRNYVPIYTGFPKEVMAMSEIHMFYNAFIHYTSGGEWVPPTYGDKQLAFEGVKNFKTVSVVIKEKMHEVVDEILTSMIMSNSALTESDFADLKDLFSHVSVETIQTLLNKKPKFKEHLIVLYSLAIKNGLSVNFKDITDVLRYVVYESTGKADLNNKERFKKIGRPERKFLLKKMEAIFRKNSSAETDLLKNKQKWLRLGERIHPREYEKRFPMTAKAFSRLRSGDIVSDESIFEAFIKEGKWHELFEWLQKRPGIFARKLFRLLSLINNNRMQDVILSKFVKIAPEVSSNVLSQIYAVFMRRMNERDPLNNFSQDNSVLYVPKNGVYTEFLLERYVTNLNYGALMRALTDIRLALISKFSKLPPFETKVVIEPFLRSVPVPYSMRTSQTGLKTLIKGTRLPLNVESKILRAYVHWYDKNGNYDLDLSATFLDKECGYVDTINWSSYKPLGNIAVHSGDVRHRRGPCAEYIDLDIEELIKKDIRYVIIDVRNFDDAPLCEVKDTVFGWMGRSAPESNDTFVPDTIEHAIPVTTDSIGSYVCALDLKHKEVVWIDINSRGIISDNNKKDMIKVKTMINASKYRLSMYDLLVMHVNARGYNEASENVEVFGKEWAFKYDEFSERFMK